MSVIKLCVTPYCSPAAPCKAYESKRESERKRERESEKRNDIEKAEKEEKTKVAASSHALSSVENEKPLVSNLEIPLILPKLSQAYTPP